MRSFIALSLAWLIPGCCFVDALEPTEPIGTPAPIPIATEGPSFAPPPVAPPTPLTALAPLSSALVGLARGPVPQAPGGASLFESAVPHEGAIERAMLVCRARVRGGGFDDGVFAGGADVSIAARLGRGEVRRTPQTSSHVYTLPVARLEPGSTVWVRVIDDDVLFDDTIAEGSTRFSRTPLELTMGQADVECRAVAPARVALSAGEEIASLAGALDRLDAIEPDLLAPELGYPRARVQPTLDAAVRAAAWVDWSDPQLEAQIERARAFDRAWPERAGRVVEAARDQAPHVGTPTAVGRRRVTVSGMACRDAADALRAESGAPGMGGCVVLATVEAGSAPLRLHATTGTIEPDAPLEAWAIDASGRTVSLTVSGRRDAHGWIARSEERVLEPGSAMELVLGVQPGVIIGFEPVLVRLRDAPSAPVVVRVE